ncbi:MAG: pseudouridine synthase [Verrucomicrobiales bacterium]|nr:pseudouridine synthase [Verrucomicrobiales bacterium]
MSLEILFQDQWIVAMNKPAGLLVHPGRDPEPPDQIAMKVLRDQIGHRVSTVHRLDRPTSGVLIFALDQKVESVLRLQFEQQTVKKVYEAIVAGKTPENWTNNSPLQKLPEEPFREASTGFERIREAELKGEVFSHLRINPESGRYHQIRKHLAIDEFPIVGDYLYGEVEMMNRIADLSGQTRLMLHACELTFFHPVEGVEMTLGCSLPERFSPFISG